MEDSGILACLKTGEDCFFVRVGFRKDEVMGLVAVGGDNDMVVEIGCAASEMKAYSPIIIVG